MLNNPLEAIEVLWTKTRQYIDTKLQLIRLQAIDRVAAVLSSVLSCIIVVLVFILFLLMFNIGLALYLNTLTNSLYMGFFIVAGFYLLVALVFFLFRKKILKGPISSFFIKRFLH